MISRRLRRPGVDAGVLDLEVPSVMVDLLAGPQLADDLDRLLEHLLADVDGRPLRTHDVLVERLAGPEPSQNRSPESAAVVAAAWAMTAGCVRMIGQVTPVPRVIVEVLGCDRPEHRPHEGTLALARDPRMVMVRDRSRR